MSENSSGTVSHLEHLAEAMVCLLPDLYTHWNSQSSQTREEDGIMGIKALDRLRITLTDQHHRSKFFIGIGIIMKTH